MDDFAWLEAWYAEQCDGDWEHGSGVKIETLDNPGWLVRVDLLGTDLQSAAVDGEIARIGEPPHFGDGGVVVEAATERWMICRVAGGHFEGAGDPAQLRDIIAAFRRWALSAASAATPGRESPRR